MEAIKINVKGLDCPVPLVEMKEALKNAKKGQLIELEFTCPEATRSLPLYANRHGHKVIGFERLQTGGWKIIVQK